MLHPAQAHPLKVPGIAAGVGAATARAAALAFDVAVGHAVCNPYRRSIGVVPLIDSF